MVNNCVATSSLPSINREYVERFLVSKTRKPKPQFGHCKSWVYVIQASDTGPVKIGIATDPWHRLDGLQCGSWEQLTLRAAVAIWDGTYAEVEAKAHQLAASQRIRGEWFRLEPLDAIACILKAAREIGSHAVDSVEAKRLWSERHKRDVQESLEQQRLLLCQKLGVDP